mmetsp:Transcript_100930/g.123647  ORF Transcript_100930/g.123647 Transcript_100930/m.123647 type:complete len:111 (-) Transcript_100930:118-450(-)
MAEQKVDTKQLMELMQQQLMVEIGQKLQKKLIDRCFKSCVSVGRSLRSSEQKCINRCTERWLDGMKVVSESLLGKNNDSNQLNMDEGLMGFDGSLTNENSMQDDWYQKQR